MRTIVDLPDAQVERLKKMAQQRGLSRAELIRRAVACYLEDQQAAGEEAFGLWRERDIEGLDYQKRLRDEWER
jgi:metal-responsive CopG/Arc/MetJ family transcriptional regulator